MKFSLVLLISMIAALGAMTLAQDTGVKLISKPKPGYTDEARRNNTAGDVTLQVEFLENGKIGKVKVVKGLPDGLAEQAIAAARKIKFEPKRVNGLAVSDTKTVEYSFDISIPDSDPDLKRQVKIIKWPDIHFNASEEKELGGRVHKVEVYFARTGIASMGDITPTVSEDLRKKFEELIRGIVFEPAVLGNGKKISVYKSFDFK